VGQPQPVFAELLAAGSIRGTVLDAGCGTGENALMVAAHGLAVWGIDLAPSAIGMARSKALARGYPPSRFLCADALALPELGMRFDTVIDSGLLHAMVDAERAAYVAALAAVVVPGGLVHVLCYADREPGETGPRRVTERELREAFADGWRMLAVREARFRTNIHRDGAQAWLATAERLG
jgi:SAM-dependent methyltransferase